MGFGAAMPVPVSEIKAYVEFLFPEWGHARRLALLELVARLDEVYFRVTDELRPDPKG